MNRTKLFESLGVKTADMAAIIAFHSFVSDRSVAVVDRPGSVELGSGVVIKVKDHYLVATAAHVLEGKGGPAAIRIVPPGNISGEELKVCRMNKVDRQQNLDIDVGWIELDAKQCERNWDSVFVA